MSSKSLLDKLLRVERTINVYSKDGDEPLEEINVDNIPFEKLKDIVPSNDDDPQLYDGYELNERQLNAINKHLEVKIEPNFKNYIYLLVCGGIYNWEK